MKRNRVSLAMLAALSVCGAVQTSSYAQGGVLMPEALPAPAVKAVPNVVEYPKKTERTEAAMPSPRAVRPVAATGRIVHVQHVKNTNLIPVAMPTPVAPQSMGMGGFVTPRPPMVSVPSISVPATVGPNN